LKNWKETQVKLRWLTEICMVMLLGLDLYIAFPAMAQEKSQKQAYELERITVTAEKRKQNIQDVPLSVSALSDIQIEDGGMLEAEDFIYQVPNLHICKISPHSSTYISMRGISTMPGDLNASPAVGIYVDSVYYSGGGDAQLLDIERIEVLRGPQGTLYGRNTEAGLINFITKKPGNEFNAKASLSYGSYNSQNYLACIGGPLVPDKLFLRFSGSYLLSDGYVENIYSGNDKAAEMDDQNARASLRWQPNAAWNIDLSMEYLKYRDGRDCWSPLGDSHSTYSDYGGTEDTDAIGNTLKAEYGGEHFILTSISSFRNWQNTIHNDGDYTPEDYLRYITDHDFDTLTQEIRLSSPEKSGPLKWLLGAYYFNENKNFDYTFDIRQGYPAWGISPYQQIQQSEVDANGYAFFGQGVYTFMERIDLTAGLRYEYEKKSLDFTEYYDPDLSAFGMGGQSVSPDDDKYSEWLPKVSVSYRWMQNLMTYISISRGYKSGGYNIFSSTYAGQTYDPEYTWNYEIGAKSAWLDNRLAVNFTAFYIDLEDQQVYQAIDASNWIYRNAGESTSKGFEVEVTAKPVTGLELMAGIGYTDSEFDEFTDYIFDRDITSPTYGQQIGEVDYSGHKNEFIPEFTYNVSAQYRHVSGFFGRLELQGVGNHYYDLENSVKEKGYALVNARLGYELKHFEIYLWGKNLLDEEYATTAVPDPAGMGQSDWYIRYGAPLTCGITLAGRF